MNGVVSYLETPAGKLITAFIGACLAVTLGAFLRAWATAKGKNAGATKEDIKEVLDRVSQVTDTTKSIEARISGTLWEKQSRWQLKQKFYVDAIVLTELAMRSARGIQRLLISVPYRAEDEPAFEEQLNASIGELHERGLKVELIMKKGRLFTDSSMRDKWNAMLAEWWKVIPPKPDPWDALVQAGKGRSYNFKLRIEEQKALAERLEGTLQKLQDDIYEVAVLDLHMK